ncbi:hypothetical protein Q3G72_007667 [Acer saccharum]|nr:hypothetical protein Q3G72_007667 [Acer saccharum]
MFLRINEWLQLKGLYYSMSACLEKLFLPLQGYSCELHLVRPLLRTEITQVVNKRAWYDATKLTTEVLSFYKRIVFSSLDRFGCS